MDKIINLHEHKFHLLSLCFNSIFQVAGLMFIIDAALIKNSILSIVIGVIFYILLVVFIVLVWGNKTLTIDGDNLIFNTGLFEKSVTNIPIESILSAEISQTFKQKIFQICQIAIDYGESSETIIFILSNNTANILQGELSINSHKVSEIKEDSCEEKTTETPYYSLSFFNLILVSFGKSTLVQKITIIILFAIFFIELDTPFYFNSIAIIVGVICLLVSKIIFIVWNFNKYYGFKLTIQDDMFLIKSGLFHTKSSTLKRNKISAVQVRQGIIQRLLKTATISVSLFGLEEASGTIIFPSVKKSLCDDIISTLLSEFSYNGDKERVKKEYKLWYPTTYYGADSNLLYLRGGIICRYQNIILLKHIDSIEIKQNPIHKSRNAMKLSVNYSGKKSDDFRKINGVKYEKVEFIERLLLNCSH